MFGVLILCLLYSPPTEIDGSEVNRLSRLITSSMATNRSNCMAGGFTYASTHSTHSFQMEAKGTILWQGKKWRSDYELKTKLHEKAQSVQKRIWISNDGTDFILSNNNLFQKSPIKGFTVERCADVLPDRLWFRLDRGRYFEDFLDQGIFSKPSHLIKVRSEINKEIVECHYVPAKSWIELQFDFSKGGNPVLIVFHRSGESTTQEAESIIMDWSETKEGVWWMTSYHHRLNYERLIPAGKQAADELEVQITSFTTEPLISNATFDHTALTPLADQFEEFDANHNLISRNTTSELKQVRIGNKLDDLSKSVRSSGFAKPD